jgi:hypothetical protein
LPQRYSFPRFFRYGFERIRMATECIPRETRRDCGRNGGFSKSQRERL